MKQLYNVVLGLALLVPFQGVFAKAKEEETTKKTTRTHKTHHKAKQHGKKTHVKAKPVHNYAHAKTAKATGSLNKSTQPAKNEKSYAARVGEYLGLSGAGAATTAAATHHAYGQHRHTGPQDWQSKKQTFPRGWDKGFEWGNLGGRRVFGGYAPEWWEKNYPGYYHRVVRPEYNKMYHHTK